MTVHVFSTASNLITHRVTHRVRLHLAMSLLHLLCNQKLHRRLVQPIGLVDVDVDVVDLRAQADASMPASNNNVKLYNISNF